MKEQLRSLFLQCVRVWKLLRRPSAEEYKTIAKISALGVLFLGFLGFIIALVMKIFV
ncbi:MAG TPA: protein translocase SEC61 complex subunit gamma [Candidatus Nanoarchaeia archaeon]|nr:protein translocase SEC61 complex subunit gamma [Candidatus Nanoarchaeia archaeon]